MTDQPKWTPGPWMLEGRWEPHMQRLGGWLSSGSQQTAHMAMFELNPLTGEPDQIRANAHLIAAAPDLYAALDALIAIDEDATIDGATLQDRVDAAWTTAKAALAKARGQA